MSLAFRIESAVMWSAVYSVGITSGSFGTLDVACAAACTVMMRWPESVSSAGLLAMPSVISTDDGAPTLLDGSETPLTVGDISPSVCVVSEKNTIDTKVSTSGTRFSSVSRNLWNIAVRRASRAAFARLAISASSAIRSRSGRRDLRRPRTVAQRDVGELRDARLLEHLHDVVIADRIIGNDQHILVVGVAGSHAREHVAQLVERGLTVAADVLPERDVAARVFYPDPVRSDPDGEQQRQ